MSWKVIEILKGIRPSIGSQEVIKSSWKILQRSEKIRSSGLPKFLKGSRKSSKSQENAQKVPKVFRPKVLNWSSKCPQIPQMVIKALEVLRGPQKVFKATSIPQNVINVLKIPWSSKVPQMFLKTVLKCSTRSHQKFLKGSSTFWEHQVVRSSKIPQMVVRSVLKNSRKWSLKGTQGPQNFLKTGSSTDPQECPQIPKVQKVIWKILRTFWEVIKRYSSVVIKVPKKFLKGSSESPVVVKSSSNAH